MNKLPLLFFVGLATFAVAAEPGETQIERWPNGAKGAFMLMFDDSIPTHVKNVIPEITKRKFTATFYVNPGKDMWLSKRNDWENVIPQNPLCVYGNHTFTHGGALTLDGIDEEFAKANEVIYRLQKNENPHLVSYAQPGGLPKEKWPVSRDDEAALLKKYNLVSRPTFDGHGAAIHQHNAADVIKLVNKAIANGSAEYIIFHGVGGDWISFQLDPFVELLNELDALRGQVWVTDHISAHKYETERDATTVKTVASTPARIELALSSTLDPALYDQPLALATRIPDAWRNCMATQNGKPLSLQFADGLVRYNAFPQNGPIVLQPAGK